MTTNNILEQLKKEAQEKISVLEIRIGELEEEIIQNPEESLEAQNEMKKKKAERDAYILFVGKIEEAAGSVDKFLELISKAVADSSNVKALERKIIKLEAQIAGK